MKTGSHDLGTAENESRSAKHEIGNRRPSIPQKMSTGAKNMKTGPDDFCTAENMKTGPDALDTAENESGRAKH
jgi:hypothetical protein